MDDKKYCKYCGELLERRRKNGKLEGVRDFNRRKFCNRSCSGKFTQLGNKKDADTAAAVKEAAKDVAGTDSEKKKSASEFLMEVVNDDAADKVTRVNAAKALLPYQERKAGEKGGKKQEQAKAAEQASKGRFGAMSGPKIVSMKK